MRLLAVLVLSVMLLVSAGGPGRAARVRTPDGFGASYRFQLWRMSGRLVAPDGCPFSYVATFFRYVEPNGVVLYPASLSVLDELHGRLFAERRTERAGHGLAELPAGALALRVGTWRLRESSTAGGLPTFDLNAKLDSVALLLHGVARKRRFALRSPTTEYDEYSSIASNGTITIDGRRLEVSGTSWLDHQLSNAAPGVASPVAQFRVQLDDGREIYLETSGSPQTRVAHRRAFLIQRDGGVVTLQPSSYQFGEHPGSTWRSPHTRTIYPAIWALHVDDKTEFLSLEPVTYDQESLAEGDGVSYWDGAVEVYDVTPGSQGLRLGSGYVLMHGYPPGRRRS